MDEIEIVRKFFSDSDNYVMGNRDAAKVIGVNQRQINRWRSYNEKFPKPLFDDHSRMVWSKKELLEFKKIYDRDIKIKRVSSKEDSAKP